VQKDFEGKEEGRSKSGVVGRFYRGVRREEKRRREGEEEEEEEVMGEGRGEEEGEEREEGEKEEEEVVGKEEVKRGGGIWGEGSDSELSELSDEEGEEEEGRFVRFLRRESTRRGDVADFSFDVVLTALQLAACFACRKEEDGTSGVS